MTIQISKNVAISIGIGLLLLCISLALIFAPKIKKVSKERAINQGLPSPRLMMADVNGNISIFEPNNTSLNSNLTIAGDIKSQTEVNAPNITGNTISGTTLKGTTVTGTDINTKTLKIGNTTIDENTLKRLIASTNIPDTRYDNQLPIWYYQNYPQMTIRELKLPDKIGINFTGEFVTLETITPWYNSSAGCIQIAYTKEGQIGYRSANSDYEWSGWTDVSDKKYVRYEDNIQFYNGFSDTQGGGRNGRVWITGGYLAIGGTGGQDPGVFKIRRV